MKCLVSVFGSYRLLSRLFYRTDKMIEFIKFSVNSKNGELEFIEFIRVNSFEIGGN